MKISGVILRDLAITRGLLALEGRLTDTREVYKDTDGFEKEAWTPEIARLFHLIAHFVSDADVRILDKDYKKRQEHELGVALDLLANRK